MASKKSKKKTTMEAAAIQQAVESALADYEVEIPESVEKRIKDLEAKVDALSKPKSKKKVSEPPPEA